MSFDLLAPHYRWMEFLLAGEKLHRCRTMFLDEIGPARHILLAGEGHGRALVECCRRFPAARVICLDASKGMLARAARELLKSRPGAAEVEFVHVDILEWDPAGQTFDLIVTNFFLDCFRPDQLRPIISRLATVASQKADWLLADFQVPSAGLKRLRGRIILWAMYLFFCAVTRLPAQCLAAPDTFLHAAGFSLHRRTQAEWGLLHSDWWRRAVS